jgi:Lanthionine synthetase C-like protein
MSRPLLTRRDVIAGGLATASTLFVLPKALHAWTTPAATDLEVALGAARWIRRSRIVTKHGVTWPVDPNEPALVALDLFNGTPGIILFHLELFDATHDAAWLDEARLGADELIAQLPSLQQTGACGLYDGLSGAAFVLEETHRATGEARYRAAATQGIGMIHALALRSTSGAEWSGRSAGYDVVSGAAGIGLFLLWAAEVIDDSESAALALAAGRRLLEVGTPDRGGTKWVAKGAVSYPNFGYGTAGVAFFLAKLMRASGDRSCMAGALSGVKYLTSIANTADGGFELPHREPGGENIHELGWCHGAAGTARLFHQLGVITGRPKWGDLTRACARSILSSGAPERQPPGYSAGADQCSGDAGIGEFFIAQQREAANTEYATMIARLSADARARAVTDADGLKWIQVADAASNAKGVAQTGFMRGAAGLGTFFLHADALAKGRRPAVTWPDSPWSSPCVAPRTKATRDMSDLNGRATPTC